MFWSVPQRINTIPTIYQEEGTEKTLGKTGVIRKQLLLSRPCQAVLRWKENAAEGGDGCTRTNADPHPPRGLSVSLGPSLSLRWEEASKQRSDVIH